MADVVIAPGMNNFVMPIYRRMRFSLHLWGRSVWVVDVEGLEKLILNPQSQLDAMVDTMNQLGQDGENPGLRAALAVLARMPNHKSEP